MARKAIYGIGFDGGNHEAVIAFDGRRIISAPNYISDGRMSDLMGLRAGAGERAGLGKDEHIIEYEGRSYFVGALAINQGREPRNSINDNGRYWQHNLLALMALASAAFSDDHITLRVVTGLPVNVYRNSSMREEVAKRLPGSYSYSYNGKPRQLTIEQVRIVMEGQAAALLAGHKNTRATQALIDMGGRTTGFVYLEEGQIVPDKCGVLEGGIERVGQVLAALVRDTHGRAMKPRDVRKALRISLLEKGRATVTVAGNEVDISAFVGTAVRSVALEIEARARQLWTDNDDHRIAFDCAQVALVGGGAYYFSDHLRDVIAAPVKVASDPELANVRAYKALADRLWTVEG